MKTLLKSSLAVLISASLLSACAGTSIAVRERPREPYYVRSAQPYRGAVYIPGEWVWRGRQYVYVQPHYVKPRAGHVWVEGRWDSSPRGYVWRKGYWR